MTETTNRTKVNWVCPECATELTVKKDTGEGVKWCVPCETGWFIIRTRRPRNR